MSEPQTAHPTAEGRRPIRRALVSVYDKTELLERGPALVDGRGRDRLHRLDGADHRRRRAARSPRSRRSPASPSASTAGSRPCTRKVHAGLLADLRLEAHRDQLRRAGHRAVRAADQQPLPVHRRPSPPAPRRTSASSRSTSAGRRWSAARRRTTPPWPWSPRPTQYDALLAALARRRLHPGGARRRLAAAAFVHTATYDVAVASWMGNVVTDTSDGTGLPGLGRGDLGQGGRAPLRREPAPARPRSTAPDGDARPGRRASSCTARRCPTTTTSTPTRPAARPHDFDAPGRRDHQARQPVRDRRRRRHRRGPPAGARLRPGVGLRRRHRHQPAGQRGHGRAGRRGVHRGDRGARLRGRRGRGAERRRRTSGSWSSSRPRRGGVEIRGIDGGLLMQTATRRRGARPGRELDAGRR